MTLTLVKAPGVVVVVVVYFLLKREGCYRKAAYQSTWELLDLVRVLLPNDCHRETGSCFLTEGAERNCSCSSCCLLGPLQEMLLTSCRGPPATEHSAKH